MGVSDETTSAGTPTSRVGAPCMYILAESVLPWFIGLWLEELNDSLPNKMGMHYFCSCRLSDTNARVCRYVYYTTICEYIELTPCHLAFTAVLCL